MSKTRTARDPALMRRVVGTPGLAGGEQHKGPGRPRPLALEDTTSPSAEPQLPCSPHDLQRERAAA